MHKHVVAEIDVDGIRTGSSTLRFCGEDILRGSIDIAPEVAYMVAMVDVVGPERTVDEAHVLHGDVLAVRYIGQTGPHGFQIGTLTIVLPTDPELFPVEMSVAVDGPRP